MKLSILNSREKKGILQKLKDQYGFDQPMDLVFLLSNKNKLYVVNEDIGKVPLESLRIDTIGLYFGTLEGESIRLSIEGSEIVGPHAIKHILELNEEQSLQWMAGEDVPLEEKEGWYIISNGTDFLGCGKVRQGVLNNFVPKERRL